MKLAAACAVSFALSGLPVAAAPKPLPKDCPREFVKAWSLRSFLRSLPEPKEPCVLRAETGIYICDHGCVRP